MPHSIKTTRKRSTAYNASDRFTEDFTSAYCEMISTLGAVSKELLIDQAAKRFPTVTRSKLLQQFRYAKNRNFVVIENNLVNVTEKGMDRLQKLKFDQLKDAVWDGKWRIVTFDVPEQKRAARDAIRALLHQMGFLLLQRSVWVTPWNCAEEIIKIQSTYGVKNDITLIVAESFDRQDYFTKKFKLKA